MSGKLAVVWLFAATVAIVVACSDKPSAPKATRAVRDQAGIQPVDTGPYVSTPNGLYDASCVYEVPEGGRYKNGNLVLKDGTQRKLAACRHLGPISGGFVSGAASKKDTMVVPSYREWAIYGYATMNVSSGQTIRHSSARWVVPEEPLDAYSGPASVVFFFPGAEDSNTIVQPVLQYGSNGNTDSSFGGAYWSIAPWMCGAVCIHGLPKDVSVGDVLGGTVDATNCSGTPYKGGSCDWSITIADSTLATSTNLTEDAGDLGNGETNDDYWEAAGGVLEVANIDGCDSLSGGPHLFSQISFKDNSGASQPSGWFPGTGSGPAPSCEYGFASTGASNVTLTDSLAPYFTAGIGGPTVVYDVQSDTGTWTANIGLPAVPPYTYSWTGLLSGTGSSVSGAISSSGYLYLRVIDSAADTTTNLLYITTSSCTPPQITC